ncbi:MAG TPA: protein kinase, partial [Acidimicrobiales bacterium]|nr:protein kinase [Acidimicrobiales bacterium]
MADGAQLSMTADGRLAVTKRAPAGAAADRLAREVEVLRRAAHPGVVELVAVDHPGDGIAVHTAFVGGGTLAGQLATMTAGRGARVAAGVAATMADIHDRGITHGRLSADHVLVGGGEHVRLCGWADATMGTGRSPGEAGVAADVEAVALLVRSLAEQAPGEDTGALRSVADRVLLAEPGNRPAMHTLAQALTTLAERPSPPATVPAPAAGDRRVAPTQRILAPAAG